MVEVDGVVPIGWSVCLPLLISPCTIKPRSSLLALAHPGGPGKRAVKRLLLLFQESYHDSSNFTECPYFTTFEWPYFGSASRYSHVVGHTGSPTHTVYVDVTLTRSKVIVMGLSNFRKLAKPCMHAGGHDRQPPSGAFW